MVDTGIFTNRTEVLYKAGVGASTTSGAEAYTNSFIAQAESFINVWTRKNYSDSYASLNTDVKSLLKEAASNIAAMYVIQYDMRNFANLAHAQTMLNVLWDRAEKCMNLLKDKDNNSFLQGA